MLAWFINVPSPRGKGWDGAQFPADSVRDDFPEGWMGSKPILLKNISQKYFPTIFANTKQLLFMLIQSAAIK